ncbi:MAG TPA: FtsX-like permease family protein, partial [Thermoanaerobaculia bacterium]|nr:FtsX-like permease family protein [Thermoanaerobaculia bacterium]
TVAVWVGQTVQSDLWLRPSRVLASPESSTFPPEILTALRRIEEIEAVDPYRGREILYRGAPVTIGSGDLAVVLDHGGLPMLEPRSDRAALKAALRDGGVIVSESFARKFGHRVGEAIAIPVPGGSQSFPIRGIYRDYSSDRGIVVMDRTMFLRHFDDPSINTIAVFLREGVPADTGRRAIERALVGHHAAFVFTNRTIRDEVMKVFDQTFMITYALLIVAIVVAVLGIVNTLSVLILERKREIALLRVGGMLQREVRTVFVLESMILGISASILGALCGWVLSFILIYVINRQSFGWTIEFHPPWLLLFMSLTATFASTLLAGFVSGRFTSRIHLARELQSE